MHPLESQYFDDMEKTLNNIQTVVDRNENGLYAHSKFKEAIEYEVQGWQITKEEYMRKVDSLPKQGNNAEFP